jgi:hypothetical protein
MLPLARRALRLMGGGYSITRMLDKTEQTGSPLQFVNGLILMITFAGARLVYGSIIVRTPPPRSIYAPGMGATLSIISRNGMFDSLGSFTKRCSRSGTGSRWVVSPGTFVETPS